jgi:hypothetical protein
MAMDTIPLAMPADLLAEVKRTADDTHLSSADVMRQAIKAGLPRVREALGAGSILDGLKPFTKAEAEACWGPQTDGDENDQIAAAMCKVPSPYRPEDFE